MGNKALLLYLLDYLDNSPMSLKIDSGINRWVKFTFIHFSRFSIIV
jgi:hypothetical protein